MRLIDADEFRYDICRQVEFIKVDDFQVVPVVDVINCWFNAPTVKAIPVEWIENYISKIKDDGMIYLSSAGCIKDMLKEWEKENADL